MQKDADCVLAEVTKKKSDSRKQLSLILALSKLRHVRDHFATQRGEKLSSEDREAFKVTTGMNFDLIVIIIIDCIYTLHNIINGKYNSINSKVINVEKSSNKPKLTNPLFDWTIT